MSRTYLSFSATVVLQAVSNGYEYGFDIMDVTGLPGGTVYPALRRLEDQAYVVSKWEKGDIAQRELRPARKYYKITGDRQAERFVKANKTIATKSMKSRINRISGWFPQSVAWYRAGSVRTGSRNGKRSSSIVNRFWAAGPSRTGRHVPTCFAALWR